VIQAKGFKAGLDAGISGGSELQHGMGHNPTQFLEH
jgi:hypothetical protein